MTRSIAALAVAFSLGGAIALAAGPLPVPNPSASPGTSFNVGVWTVHAAQLDVSFKTGDFSTPTKIVMNRDGGDITADRANGNYKSKNATLYGHVVMHDSQGNFAGLSQTTPSQSRGPATLTADQVQIDGLAKVYKANGNVHYVQADTSVDADRGTLNDTDHDLYLEGHVHIVQGDRNMVADHVRYNTISGDAHAEGDVTMQFPSAVNPHIATPKPIHIKNPLQKKPEAAPTPTP
jgi:lipopolysaccharide assembly outer membrane protein LptD (OstA)